MELWQLLLIWVGGIMLGVGLRGEYESWKRERAAIRRLAEEE